MSPKGSAVAFAVVAAMALTTGCGNGSKTVPNTALQRQADRRIAEQAVLTASDLPGYTATPHKDSPDSDIDDATLRKFASCMKLPKAMAADLLNDTDRTRPAADSPDFAQESSDRRLSFENNVEIERSSKVLSEEFDAITAEHTLPCWRALFQSALEQTAPPNGSVRDLSVAALDTRDIADQSAGFSVNATLSGVVTVKASFNFYFVRSDRAAITLFASGIGAKVDHSLAVSLLRTVADRLEGKL